MKYKIIVKIQPDLLIRQYILAALMFFTLKIDSLV